MAVKRWASDKWFSEAIRHRDGGCVRCLTNDGQLQCMHIITRANVRLRWDPDNAVAGCASCHWHFTNEPFEWTRFIDSLLGPNYYDDLKRTGQQMLRHNPKVRAEVAKHYREEYRRMVEQDTRDLIPWPGLINN